MPWYCTASVACCQYSQFGTLNSGLRCHVCGFSQPGANRPQQQQQQQQRTGRNDPRVNPWSLHNQGTGGWASPTGSHHTVTFPGAFDRESNASRSPPDSPRRGNRDDEIHVNDYGVPYNRLRHGHGSNNYSSRRPSMSTVRTRTESWERTRSRSRDANIRPRNYSPARSCSRSAERHRGQTNSGRGQQGSNRPESYGRNVSPVRGWRDEDEEDDYYNRRQPRGAYLGRDGCWYSTSQQLR
jgi:hypothetical protein